MNTELKEQNFKTVNFDKHVLSRTRSIQDTNQSIVRRIDQAMVS